MVVRLWLTSLRLICKSVPPSKVCSFERPRFFSKRSIPVLEYKMSQGDDNDLLPLQNICKEKGEVVRKLKETGAPESDVKKAITELLAAKKVLENKQLELSKAKDGDVLDEAKLADLLKQKFFYDQAFSIYGGIAGLYDFGPFGCAMMENILSVWRQFFILNERMLEVKTSILTPEPVLKASGHVDRFADYMVKDKKTGECFRADHLIEGHLQKLLADNKTSETVKAEIRNLLPKVDGFSRQDMEDTIKKYDMKFPTTNNDISEPQEFNLMFGTHFGPTGLVKGYLRPETAQGIFVNFKGLLDIKKGKLPFAAAQIGYAFRNEISPRSGLLRVREFIMAEIEHFCDPRDKSHKKFKLVENTEMTFYSACNQMDGELPQKMTIGEAVKSGLVNNETLGYFLARVFLFLTKVGVKKDKLRFRQHMSNEMAHYATDCWDAECKTSYGWVECVGNADRSCYDLSQHTRATGVKLVAERKLPTPVEKQFVEVVVNKGLAGKKFKKDAKIISDELSKFTEEQVVALEKHMSENKSYILKAKEGDFEIERDMIDVKRTTRLCHTEEFVPSVIEPSFGIGRIMYVIFEHNFRIRDNDEQRTYLALPPAVAPYKCVILPLSGNTEFEPFVDQLSELLTSYKVSHDVDDGSVSIGRRYARTDQIAIPFGITVDFDTVNQTPHTATLRERDSMKQIRAEIAEIPKLVSDLCEGRTTWDEVLAKYPIFEKQGSG